MIENFNTGSRLRLYCGLVLIVLIMTTSATIAIGQEKPIEDFLPLKKDKFYGLRDTKILELDAFFKGTDTGLVSCMGCDHAISPTGHLFRVRENLFEILDAGTNEFRTLLSMPQNFGDVRAIGFITNTELAVMTFTHLYTIDRSTGAVIDSEELESGGSPFISFGPVDIILNPISRKIYPVRETSGSQSVDKTTIMFPEDDLGFGNQITFEGIISRELFMDVNLNFYGISLGIIYQLNPNDGSYRWVNSTEHYNEVFGIGEIYQPLVYSSSIAIEFGNVLVDEMKKMTVDLTNKTDASIDFTQTSLGGLLPALSIDSSLPVTLQPGAKFSFELSFAPTERVEFTTFLKLHYANSIESWEDSILVSGQGVLIDKVDENILYALGKNVFEQSTLYPLTPTELTPTGEIPLDRNFQLIAVDRDKILHGITPGDGDLYQIDISSGASIFVTNLYSDMSTDLDRTVASAMTFDHENSLYINRWREQWAGPGTSGQPSTSSNLQFYNILENTSSPAFDSFISSLTFDPSDYSIYTARNNEVGIYSLSTRTSKSFATIPNGSVVSMVTAIDNRVFVVVKSDLNGDHLLYQLDKNQASLIEIGNLSHRYSDITSAIAEPPGELIITSINEVRALKQTIKVYPNPANESLQIHVTGLNAKFDSVQLFDLSGSALQTYAIKGLNSAVLKLKSNREITLESGIYLLYFKTSTGNRTAFKKVIIR